jgi:hypothetical protein
LLGRPDKPLLLYFFISVFSFFCFLFLDSNLILKSVVQEFGYTTLNKIHLIYYWYKILS